MTNTEAAQIIREERRINAEIFSGPFFESLEVACKALEVRPICPVDFPTDDDPYPVCPLRTPEWTPVKTRLPDKNGFYLVTVVGYGYRPHMRILGYDAIGKKWGEGGVVAWCNILPYEEG